MIGYRIESFGQKKLTIYVEFENPLYVSTFNSRKDELKVIILLNELFMAKEGMRLLEANYTLVGIKIPTQARSEKDFEEIKSTG